MNNETVILPKLQRIVNQTNLGVLTNIRFFLVTMLDKVVNCMEDSIGYHGRQNAIVDNIIKIYKGNKYLDSSYFKYEKLIHSLFQNSYVVTIYIFCNIPDNHGVVPVQYGRRPWSSLLLQGKYLEQMQRQHQQISMKTYTSVTSIDSEANIYDQTVSYCGF